MRRHFGYALALCAGAALAVLAGAPAALAQALQNPAQLNIPYGKSYNDFNQPFNPRTRDANGNRAIINGRILTGGQSTLSGGIGGNFFSGGGSFGNSGGFGGFGGSAVGNQLNVITNGNWNTVIIDSTQINNGNQTVNLNGNTQNPQNPPQQPDLAADGPFVVAPHSTLPVRDKTGASVGRDTASANTNELNGGIRLDDQNH